MKNKKDLEPIIKIKIDDREYLSELLFAETEDKTRATVAANERFKKETFYYINGSAFTIGQLESDYNAYIAEAEAKYEPKFSLFFKLFGDMCNWTDQQRKAYRKPVEAPKTIIEVIYSRYPDGMLQYLRAHNKYVGYFVRRTKNYKLLNEQGIFWLEQFIDDANKVMPTCKSYLEFRRKMHDLYSIPYQPDLGF